MSILDQIDKNQERQEERQEERRQRLSENNEKIEYSKEMKKKMKEIDDQFNETQEIILSEIKKGAVSGDGWVRNNKWVDVEGGKQFQIPEGIEIDAK